MNYFFQLWLSLADKYLKSKNVDWAQQREKCFCEEWREDDEELGIQIVKVSSSHGQVILQGIINDSSSFRTCIALARICAPVPRAP